MYVFGGQGGAVCRIYGVGRDAGPGCLGGADGDNRYWAYFRAPAGTSTFTYSSIGAGSARVHDGDVEGWKFGTGTAPAYVSLATLSPPPPPTTPPAAAATQSPTGAPAGDNGNAPAAGAAAGTAAAGTPTTATTQPKPGAAAAVGAAKGSGTSTKHTGAAVDHETDANGKPISTKLASADDGGGGGSSWSLLLFAVLLVAIVAAILIVRRVRHRNAIP